MSGPATILSSGGISNPVTVTKRLTRLAAFVFAGAWALSAACAQQAIVQPGYAVVTGFAGVAAAQAPAGANPFDYVGIDLAAVGGLPTARRHC